MVSISSLKLKSSSGDMFPFPFLKVMMVEGRKDWRRFYENTRKEDLVYLDNELLCTVKFPSSCKILEISKPRNTRKKIEKSIRKKKNRNARQITSYIWPQESQKPTIFIVHRWVVFPKTFSFTLEVFLIYNALPSLFKWRQDIYWLIVTLKIS